MNKQEIIEKFGSTADFTTIHQKASFMALSDPDFELLMSLGADEIKIHCTPQALKYCEQRKAGALPVPFDDGGEPSRDDSYKILGIERPR
jgi:hypothetical protein